MWYNYICEPELLLLPTLLHQHLDLLAAHNLGTERRVIGLSYLTLHRSFDRDSEITCQILEKRSVKIVNSGRALLPADDGPSTARRLKPCVAIKA